MAAYDFPNSPSDGDTVTVSGVTYTYNSSKTRWDGAAESSSSGSSTTVYATIDDLPLSGASTGDQAYVSGNNRLYIWNGTGWYNIALINTTPSISGALGTYALATDGTATTVTITATDPEGIPITYSIASDTSGNVATVTQGTGSNTNVFTITPSTNSAHAGTFSLTFRASDGVNIATAVSSFTLVFNVSNSKYTTALVTSVGANNAVNEGTTSFKDSSTNNHTISRYGTSKQQTFSPYRSGGYSTYFDGNGDYLGVANSTDFDFDGDFTIELWMYREADSSGTYQAVIGGNGTSDNGWNIYITNSNNTLGFYFSSFLLSGGVVADNQWNHIAVTRSGTSLKMFLNGSVADSATNSTTFTDNSAGGGIRIGYDFGANGYFKGYIRDVRIVKGTAVYTSAFTSPTAPLTAVTNTSLLACHLPYLEDGSTNGHAITANGDVKAHPLSPYDYIAYAASDHSGSVRFDGNSDYLTSVSNGIINFGTGDFTAEGWFYLTANPSNYITVLASRASNASQTGFVVAISASDFYVYSGAHIVQKGSAIYKNQWYHWAYTRESGTHRLFLNGALLDSDTTARTYSDDTFWIGAKYDGTEYFTGHQSDIRIVKGTAVYTSAFTPPTSPVSAVTNTSVLLPFDDAAIIDKSQSARHVALFGDVKSSTTQSKYLSSSIYFDGTGDYIRLENQGLSNFGTLPFTAEGWFYLTATPANYMTIAQSRNMSSSTTGWAMVISASDLYFDVNGSIGAKGSAVSTNTWYHWAVARDSSNNLRVFLDGTQQGSTVTSTHDFTLDIFWLGAKYNVFESGGDVVHYFPGYMSDVRMTKGYARYTANFTAPTAALEG